MLHVSELQNPSVPCVFSSPVEHLSFIQAAAKNNVQSLFEINSYYLSISLLVKTERFSGKFQSLWRMIHAQCFQTVSNTPDFHISRCACSVSPHCGERWWNSSSLMAHRSLPVRSWKAFPAWGSRYRCSVHSSHFCTFPVFHSIGSAKANISGRESELIHYNGPVTVTNSSSVFPKNNLHSAS